MEYKRFLKTDWKARWIWLCEAEADKNAWLCFNKKINISEKPLSLMAKIAAENKYWLYINGECVVREGGLKRGPTPTGIYFDEVEIAEYLNEGENIISILVWYWGNEASYSSTDAGQGGLLFEAENGMVSILSDRSWSVAVNPAFKEDKGKMQPNYRLPESNVYYDARCEVADWNRLNYDFSHWSEATEYAVGGEGCWGETYSRDIPMFKDFGLKDYENSKDFEGKSYLLKKKITLKVPYNAQLTPYLEVEAKAGKKIVITTENTDTGSIHSTYITRTGVQSFESPAWFNGEMITYEIPSGVKIISLKYRESGYNTEFCGSFTCENSEMNTLWQKSLRTLYVTMRDNFMDCPDRERAQWWGDVTNEMMMTVYSLAPSSYLLYRKGVSTLLSYIDPETKVLQTVVPIKNDYFELPCQQLAGVCGFWTYYMYTGDVEFIKSVYGAAVEYVNLWNMQENGLVEHRSGSWDWQDWGNKIDVAPLENAWYYYALSSVKKMADVLDDGNTATELESRMKSLYSAYQTLWTGEGYKCFENEGYDDRGNAVAVLSGICPEENYGAIKEILFGTRNSSPYMEYYVLESLCRMGEYSLAEQRMCERYAEMIDEDYSTLWENWIKKDGTSNHAWTGGPLVIMSKHIAGIRPVNAGYEKVEINPQYELHNSISCTVPTIKGYINFDYRNENGKRIINLEYPENMETFLHIPENAVVTVNGKSVESVTQNIC
ncbi:MAG: alpha-L-rhamnosidase C-terminal domain-containing protein [Acutalibacteraceae bacterium]|nr:alpha-L-rhamnosidase C-terminal domain-containing protein [Acutalibacteraceae bacterium]